MEKLLFVIPLAPLAGAIVNGSIAIAYSHREKGPGEGLVGFIGCAFPLVSFVLASALFHHLLSLQQVGGVVTQTVFPWIVSGSLRVEFSFLVDALSMVMVLVVTGVGTIIHFYSLGYMHEDRGFARYFAYLNLFMFSMLTLVMAKNLPLLFVGWEGVGLCSYLLIGFWYEDMEKAAAGKKAFIVNRLGDLAFLLGIFMIFAWTSRLGTPALDFVALRSLVAANPSVYASLATGACLLLFVGACGKSAQIPLYVWLPDAMAGPTPVSALIHAATMVTAGVYMVARLSFLYNLSSTAMGVVACVGALTALFAASIGICQKDIKRVLAYSTISQLGYMFIAVGVGAYAAGIFHLVTHAFFKACLFLGAGSVIHAMAGEMDMFKMGSLRKKMKITALTFLVASLAISGVPPFSGFFSKEEILWRAISAPLSPGWLPGVLWGIGLVTAGVTAFYVFRAVFLTFYGERRYEREAGAHLHESPPVMTFPLVLLAAGSLAAGFLGVPGVLGGANRFHEFLAPSTGEAVHAVQGGMGNGLSLASGATGLGTSHRLEVGLMVLSILVVLSGILTAYVLYIKRPLLPSLITARLRRLYDLVFQKYYVDEAYEKAFVRPGFILSDRVMYRIIDVGLIDGFVNGLGTGVRLLGSALRLLQTGVVRTYALFMLLGLLYLVYRLVV